MSGFGKPGDGLFHVERSEDPEYVRSLKKLNMPYRQSWLVGEPDLKASSDDFHFANEAPYWQWDPAPDITTYELARCIPVIYQITISPNRSSAVDALPDECRRHFAKIDPKSLG